MQTDLLKKAVGIDRAELGLFGELISKFEQNMK